MSLREIPEALFCLHVDSRIHKVYILVVQLLTQQLNSFTETLKMNDLPFPKEFDHIIYVRIVRQSKNIIISYSSFLLCCVVFKS